MRALIASDLSGAYVAIITPMTVNGDIDYDHLARLVESLIASGVRGLVPCGTTGQGSVLSRAEHLDVAQFVARQAGDRCQIIVAAGSNNTVEAIDLSNSIEDKLNAPVTMLHVTGYYNVPPQEGLLKHFLKVADNLHYRESTIILYNVPSRTVCSIAPETIVRLAEHPKIIGVKEVASIAQAEYVVKRTDPESFRVLSGEDDIIAAMMEKGATGTISGSANLAPKLFVELCDAGLRGDFKKAGELQEKLMPLIRFVFSVRNPIPLAHAFRTYLRLPLCRIEGVDAGFAEMAACYHSSELNL